MTPLAAMAVALGGGAVAQASGCLGFGTASITPPAGPVTVGSPVTVKASVHNMLLRAHLQVSGPGIDQQVGDSVFGGDITDQITVPEAGTFTLAVIGNATGCTYDSVDFAAKEPAAASKPTHGSAHKTLLPSPGRAGAPKSSSPFPSLTPGRGGTDYLQKPFTDSSPFSLPAVGPASVPQGFDDLSPDPQVAEPPARPVARDVVRTTPVKWGQSIALASVLLLLSAHLGMLSRRQRLAAEGPAGSRAGKAMRGRKSPGKKAARETAHATSVLAAAGGEAPAGRAAGDTTDRRATTRDAGSAPIADTPSAGTSRSGAPTSGSADSTRAGSGAAGQGGPDRRVVATEPASRGMNPVHSDVSANSWNADEPVGAAPARTSVAWDAPRSSRAARHTDPSRTIPFGVVRPSTSSSYADAATAETPDACVASDGGDTGRTSRRHAGGRAYQGRRRRS
jgi:hypothetical protein